MRRYPDSGAACLAGVTVSFKARLSSALSQAKLN